MQLEKIYNDVTFCSKVECYTFLFILPLFITFFTWGYEIREFKIWQHSNHKQKLIFPYNND